MLILYETMTGNVKRFLNKVGLEHQPIDRQSHIDEPFILVTNTIGFGQPPESVTEFLSYNGHFIRAVAASGNRNWGPNFAHSADVISAKYNVPILYKFELGGTLQDVMTFRERVNAFDRSNDKVAH
ncbi:class Ib ribonucleoside-diphosphate reductase assembly flavoprotein NrdI [Terrilactibacillus sp. BCM23-1]|uniref:Protein NrdI n=1 Tax=Terrilactibacillus tamarindi TaxID=2599694 RepID=A0A6N8CMB3_9BACI|nr:class Ib ribonucleoside-diphosphate reductase assembly flavoprotein NrdI [Terrilactibacillus tamarindi]MTT30738.1 class Ib ribonucleoside-diphosphate reductase assembly flavoprotein NrdI [Terrilactibacillus tamarindi]